MKESTDKYKYIPAVIGETMIGACKWIGKFTDKDIAFNTWEEAIQWLKDRGHKNKTVVK